MLLKYNIQKSLALSISSIGMLFMMLKIDKFTFSLATLIIIAFSLLLCVVIYWLVKSVELIIDTSGVYISHKIWNKLFHVSVREHTRIVKVNSLNNQPPITEEPLSTVQRANIDSQLRRIDKDAEMICIFGVLGNRKCTISNQHWQIDNFDAIDKWFVEQCYNVEYTDMKTFHLQLYKSTQLSKVTGYFTYTAIVIILICLLLPMLDKHWSTIYYGMFNHSLWLIFIISTILSFWIMHKKRTDEDELLLQIFSRALVSVLFASAITSLWLFIMLLIVPIAGKQSEMEFEYQQLNNAQEEIWVATHNKEIELFCKKADLGVGNHTNQVVQVTTLGTIIRVNTQTACKKSTFLKDGMLPHK